MQYPARSRWIKRRGRIGFTMSTQRRASRTVPAIEAHRIGLRFLTAPLMSIIWLTWAWLRAREEASRGTVTDREATNSLLSDHHNETLAWLDSRTGSPPGAPRVKLGRRTPRCDLSDRGYSGLRVSHWSSLTYVPNLLPVRAHLQTTLPIAPAGKDRWAERHDGKRDLYFQHAA